MGKYSDDFFKEYDEKYPDPPDHNDFRGEEAYSFDQPNTVNRNQGGPSDRYGRQDIRRDYRRQGDPYQRSRADGNDRAGYGTRPSSSYGSDDYHPERYGFDDGPSQRSQRPIPIVRKKRRMTRSMRRTLIVLILLIVALLIVLSVVAVAKSVGNKDKPQDDQKAAVTVEETTGEPAPEETTDDTASTIDPNKPMVALTFDDGPAVGGSSGDRILDTLEKYNAKGTFFMVGCNAAEAPDNLKRKVELGMEIGNHTWNHTNYGDSVSPEDISKASDALYEVCGQYPTAFRSPGGMTTQTILTECAAEKMAAYYWTIDTEDWNSRDADKVYHAVMDYVKDGDIILMHEIYDSTADAVEKMVPALQEQGYQLVTCYDLVKYKSGSDPVPGKEYNSATTEMVR